LAQAILAQARAQHPKTKADPKTSPEHIRPMRLRQLAQCIAAGLLLAAVGSAQTTTNPYISSEDEQFAALAHGSKERYCTLGLQGDVNAADARADLLDALGGSNVFVEALQDAENQDAVSAQLRTKMGAMVVKAFGAVIVAIICIVCGLACCWSGCPCCRKCRCGAKERMTHPALKFACLIPVVLLFIMTIVSITWAVQGYSTIVDGGVNVACTSAELLDTTLEGANGTHNFIGLMPILGTFHDLEVMLDNNSQFMTQLGGILDDTVDVSTSVTLGAETLNLLGSAMANAANNAPSDGAGNSVLHTCEFCSLIGSPIAAASSALADGIAQALATARNEVNNQLSPAKRAELQATMRQASEPVRNAKDSFRQSMGYFVDPEQYQTLQDTVKGPIQMSVVVDFLGAFALCICGGVGTVMFLFREKKNNHGENNPYSKIPNRCTCCAWCCGLVYVPLTMLFGGILLMITIPLSGVCILLDDVDGTLLRDMGPALGQNFSTDNGNMLLSIVDGCINPSNTSANANLMDLIYERTSSGGTVTMSERLITQVTDPINNAFGGINSANSSSSGGLATNPKLVELRTLLAANPISSLIIADSVQMPQDPLYSAMAPSLLAIGYATSVNCVNHTASAPSSSDSDLDGTIVPGMNNFQNKLDGYGPQTGPAIGDCVSKVDCSALSDVRLNECNAGNNYMDLYGTIATMTTFRCDLFETPGDPSVYCDPKDMSWDAINEVWLNDCVQPDGSVIVKRRTCTLAEFDTYYNEFDVRVRKTMERIDDSATRKAAEIKTSLKNLVDEFLIDPVTNLVNGLTCGWLPPYYHGFIDGLCFQTVWGLRRIGQAYVMCASFTLVFVFTMYIVWRRSVDNVNAWAYPPRANS